jgi:hypothetical protein
MADKIAYSILERRLVGIRCRREGMITFRWFLARCVKMAGSGSCPVAGYSTCGNKASGSSHRDV